MTTITVLHSMPTWLPQTMTWLYNQIVAMPATIENHIVCKTTANLDQFPAPHLHLATAAPPLQQWWDKGLRRLQLRDYFGYTVAVAQRTRAQVLHSHFGHRAWENLGTARRAHLKHVVTFYGYDVNQLPQEAPIWRTRYAHLFAAADQFLCEGPFMAAALVNLGCPPAKVRVHHLGVMVDEIAYRPRLWQPGTPLKVLIVATFTEKKGIPDALAALGQLHRETPLQVTIIGDATDHPLLQAEKTRILRTIAEAGLTDVVTLRGFQPYSTVLDAAYDHHLFLSPSVTAANGDTEGGAPVTLIDMAATGMPIVSTRHCDIPEVVLPDKTGWLAAEHDVAGLVEQLRWLVNHPTGWRPFLDAGRRRIEDEFNAVTQGQRLSEIYRMIL
jgi:colanic acid/amylovoran biosynthesis glycosyltransferase